MKKSIFIISAISLLGLSIIWFLSFDKDNTKNGFKRILQGAAPQLVSIIDIPNSEFCFAGEDKNGNTVLFNFKNRNFYKLGPKNITLIELKVSPKFNYKSRLMYASMGYGATFLNNNEGDVSVIKDSIINNFNIPSMRYDHPKVISSNSAIVRSFYTVKGQRVRTLKKLTLTDTLSSLKSVDLPIQVDGFYCNDGTLHYNKDLQKLYYLFSYRGEILTLDTSLKMLSTIKTIDTITKSNIKVVSVNINFKGRFAKKNIQVKQNNIVNALISTDQKFIYVCSKIKGDNEKYKDSHKNILIDVYSIKSEKYLYSFYLPKLNRDIIFGFEVKKNNITVITENRILTYKITKHNQEAI
ncbi:hypothetical protein [Pedobacter hiemivivus]|uniref:Uncharacterized protein n=1 Tax=Pedobacter hiemivivus TaxID=2530454 RepID=A0A4R0NIF1_9SPHI|nr:hypothetical protein [Pedobacter hiemivivus]TCC99567.1 hypothetical protein EZ444_02510 [Pedobacter hiemivivus]